MNLYTRYQFTTVVSVIATAGVPVYLCSLLLLESLLLFTSYLSTASLDAHCIFFCFAFFLNIYFVCMYFPQQTLLLQIRKWTQILWHYLLWPCLSLFFSNFFLLLLLFGKRNYKLMSMEFIKKQWHCCIFLNSLYWRDCKRKTKYFYTECDSLNKNMIQFIYLTASTWPNNIA